MDLRIIIFAVCTLFSCLGWAIWNPVLIQNDGVQYLSTAFNWLAGNGFSTSVLVFNPHFQGILPAVQTVWPPGYPFAIAVVSLTGLSLAHSALVVNLIAHAAVCLLTYLVLVRLDVSRRFALVAAIVFYFTSYPWSYALALIAEPLFTCFMLASILALPGLSDDRSRPWLVCGALLAACLCVRYTGVLTVVGTAVGIAAAALLLYRHKRQKLLRKFLNICVLISLPIAAYAILKIRIYLLTDLLLERDAGVKELQSAKELLWNAKILFGFGDGGIFTPLLSNLLFVVFGLSVIVSLVLCFLMLVRQYVGGKSSRKSIQTLLFGCVLVGQIVVFITFFAVQAFIDSSVNFVHRYMYQILPPAYILFCVFVYRAMQLDTRRFGPYFVKAAQLSLLVSGLLFVTAQANQFSLFASAAKLVPASQRLLNSQIEGKGSFEDVVKACFQRDDTVADPAAGSIWSNDGQQLNHFSGISTLTMGKTYGHEAMDFLALEQTIDTYDVRLFVIYNDMDDPTPAYLKKLDSVRAWLKAQKNITRLEVVEQSGADKIDVDLFLISDRCSTAS